MIEEARQRRTSRRSQSDLLSNHLEIRALRPDDAQRWFEMRTDPVQVAIGSPAFVAPPGGAAELAEQIERARAAYEALTPGTLAVVDVEDPDRLLGDIAWRFDLAPQLGVADIGYGVHSDARGRGVATRAIVLMVRWLTTDDAGPRLARVQLDHSVENVASCRAALAAGLEKEGVRRGFLPLRDPDAPDGVRRHDVCLHGVLAADIL